MSLASRWEGMHRSTSPEYAQPVVRVEGRAERGRTEARVRVPVEDVVHADRARADRIAEGISAKWITFPKGPSF